MSIDSYKLFLDEFGISEERFFRFGLEESKFINAERAKEEWEKLKDSIQSKQKVYIRAHGVNGQSTQLFLDFYKTVFEIDVGVDFNDKPTRLLEKSTGFTKNKNIFNYQVSHVFEKTKNIYAFTAPWNIAFVPKIFDPLTGHETKKQEIDIDKFQTLFQQKCYELHSELIDEFNQIVTELDEKINNYFKEIRTTEKYPLEIIEKFEINTRKEFTPISVKFA